MFNHNLKKTFRTNIFTSFPGGACKHSLWKDKIYENMWLLYSTVQYTIFLQNVCNFLSGEYSCRLFYFKKRTCYYYCTSKCFLTTKKKEHNSIILKKINNLNLVLQYSSVHLSFNYWKALLYFWKFKRYMFFYLDAA